MQTFGSLLLTLLAASSLVSAAPSPEPGNAASEGGTFRVPVVARATGTRLSVAEMHARVLRKYGRPIPPQTAKAVARAQEARAQAKKAKKRGGGLAGFLNRRLDGGIAQPLTGDVMYLTEVQIGTPPKLFHLDFDTGSDDAWVFGTDLPKTEMNGQQIYDPAQSSTSALLKGATWNITYGDHSSSSGIVYTDKMAVGDVVSEKQAVGVAQNLSKGFAKESTSDGLLGLAPKGNTIKPEAQPSFFQNVIPTLKAPLFTVNLNHKTSMSLRPPPKSLEY